MAYDLKLTRICDHLQIEERYLEPDARTIKLMAPMTNPERTRVFRNDQEVSSDYFIDGEEINKFGWTTTVDPDASSDWYNQSVPQSLILTRRSIYLNQAQPGLDDIWRAQYFTAPEYCRKCRNVMVIDDIVFQQGRLQIVRNAEKLGQDLRKMVITLRGSNIFHQWYGTFFVNYIGRGQRGSVSGAKLYSEVEEGISYLIQVQDQQVVFQKLTAGERIKRILDIKIESVDIDPTLMRLTVTLETRASEAIEITTLVTLNKGPLYYGNNNVVP